MRTPNAPSAAACATLGCNDELTTLFFGKSVPWYTHFSLSSSLVQLQHLFLFLFVGAATKKPRRLPIPFPGSIHARWCPPFTLVSHLVNKGKEEKKICGAEMTTGANYGTEDPVKLLRNDCRACDRKHEEQEDEFDVGADEEYWEPSGNQLRDYLHFLGPGWLVSIAYVDPGNYQADILSGASAGYSLLFAVWWTAVLSIYVQVLCVRLAYYGRVNLAQAQAKVTTHYIGGKKRSWHRYLNWFLAETSAIITDLPEVVGIGVACNIFFGWPYYVGVLLSLITTMLFLATQNYGIRVMESIIFFFVMVMSVSLFVEMAEIGVDQQELYAGWLYGFTDLKPRDIFAVTGIVGSCVMPHNLYLHSAVCKTRRVRSQHLDQAVKWSSLEPIFPILFSFFVNLAIISISTQSFGSGVVVGRVGLTTFASYLSTGSFLFGIALLASGQSSAITTTYAGQHIMDGFLNIQLPIRWRAIFTRLVAIFPCVIVSVFMPHQLNQLVNIVNSCLSLLLPFAFTPLVKYNCSPEIVGKANAFVGLPRFLLYLYAFGVWALNAFSLSANGGGFFGNWKANMPPSTAKTMLTVLEVSMQLFYAWWNLDCVLAPVDGTTALLHLDEEGSESTVNETEACGSSEHDCLVGKP